MHILRLNVFLTCSYFLANLRLDVLIKLVLIKQGCHILESVVAEYTISYKQLTTVTDVVSCRVELTTDST